MDPNKWNMTGTNPLSTLLNPSPVHAVGYHKTILELEGPPVTIYSAGYVNIADSKVPTQINHNATFQSEMAFRIKKLDYLGCNT